MKACEDHTDGHMTLDMNIVVLEVCLVVFLSALDANMFRLLVHIS